MTPTAVSGSAPRNSGQGKARTGRLFIISAPSGAGKTSLCDAIRKHFPDLAYSISYTTRADRKGEQDGRDYFFISEQEFQQGIANGRWAEWAEVHGHFYGTSAHWITQALSQGRDVLMDLDIQGTRKMLKHFPDAVTIFIMPPSLEELVQDPDRFLASLASAVLFDMAKDSTDKRKLAESTGHERRAVVRVARGSLADQPTNEAGRVDRPAR